MNESDIFMLAAISYLFALFVKSNLSDGRWRRCWIGMKLIEKPLLSWIPLVYAWVDFVDEHHAQMALNHIRLGHSDSSCS